MSEPGASADGGLASRISKPDINTTSTSWADEVNSPSNQEAPFTSVDNKTSKPNKEPAESKEEPIPQIDGATEPFGGSQLQEPEYQVEIKLADMQADPNNPLYSASSFDQLGLYVVSKDSQPLSLLTLLGTRISSKALLP